VRRGDLRIAERMGVRIESKYSANGKRVGDTCHLLEKKKAGKRREGGKGSLI